MRRFAWNLEKNTQLIQERHISFERVVYHIEHNGVLDVIEHPNPTKYPNQKMFIVNLGNYAYLVPFVENGAEIFLKTIIPSRKATRKYLEMNNLNQEEKKILESYENDEWVSALKPSDVKKYKAAAKNTFKKDKRVNIRMTEMDLELLQERALVEGLPYQTLMASVLHKYVTGRLVDKGAV